MVWEESPPDCASSLGHCIRLEGNSHFGLDENGAYYCLARVPACHGRYYAARSKHGHYAAYYVYGGSDQESLSYVFDVRMMSV